MVNRILGFVSVFHRSRAAVIEPRSSNRTPKFPAIVSCDVLKLLKDKLLNNVIRSIFIQLDEESLRQAELVSQVWREVILEECIWKFSLRNKVLTTPLWEKFIRNKEIEWQVGPTGQCGHIHLKNIYKKIKKRTGGTWKKLGYSQFHLSCH